MKCPNCKREWKTEPKTEPINRCPFCSSVIDPRKEPQTKEPFYFTWGLIFEDNLRRAGHNPSESDFISALENYSKAIKENPSFSDRVADFILQYPQFSDRAMKMIPVPENFPDQCNDMPACRKQIIWLYLKAISEKTPGAPLKLIRYISSFAADRQETLSILSDLIYSTDDWKDDPQYYLPMNAQTALLQQEYRTAVKLIKEILHAQNARLIAVNPDLLYELTGIPESLKERIEWIESAVKNRQIMQMIQGFVRPLKDPDHKFDQLQMIDEEVISLIRENFNEFESVLKRMVEKETALSGIHLFVQQLDRLQILPEKTFDALLELHYQKVYMKPYSWISETDYVIDPEFI